MATHVDPIIAEKLGAFARRRNKLIIQRGACAGLVSLIAIIFLVTPFDWMFFLSDAMLWIFSLMAYVSVAAIVWWTCLRMVMRLPGPAKMARLLEAAQPELREDLISAVELGDAAAIKAWDSEQFRQLLQDDVSHRLMFVNVKDLLPQRLIQPWVIAALAAVAICLLLLVLPGLRFGQRMARVLLPMADIERVSLTKVNILAPDPTDSAVPWGETVQVVVELSGPEAEDNVTLETFRKGKGRQRVMMTRSGSSQRQFSAVVKVGQESVRYRIRANDAQTRKHLISSRERPHVVTFRKTYRYPEYTQLPNKTESDNSGDLIGVDGTTVDLVIETNEPIERAHLTIEKGGKTETIPLINVAAGNSESDARTLAGTIALDRPGAYRVHLVASETGFENKFSPEYQLLAQPDLVPSIRITQPTQSILVPPDEIIALQGHAEDDWALDHIEKHIRVNGAEWQKTNIKTFESSAKVATEFDLEQQWDLYDLNVNPGDEVITKLVAFDRKGSFGESKPLRVIISSRGFDPSRLHRLTATREAYDSLVALTSAAEQANQNINAALANVAGASQLERQQAILDASEATKNYANQSDKTIQLVKAAAQASHAGREASDVVLVGRLVSRIAADDLTAAQHHLSVASRSNDPAQIRNALNAAQSAVGQMARQSNTAAGQFGNLVFSDTFAIVADDLTNISQMQRNALTSVRENAGNVSRQRLVRGQKAIAGHVEVVNGLLEDLTKRTDGRFQRRVSMVREQLDELKSSVEVGFDDGDLIGRASRLQSDIELAIDRSFVLLKEMTVAANASRQEMASSAGQSHEFAPRVANDARGTNRERTELIFTAAIIGLKSRAALEESRSDANSKFVADLSRASKALASLHATAFNNAAPTAKASGDLDRLAAAVHVISVSHQVDDLSGGVSRLAQSERNSNPKRERGGNNQSSLTLRVNRKTVFPRDWDWCSHQYGSLVEQMSTAAVNPEAVRLLKRSHTSNEFGTVGDELAERPSRKRRINAVPRELDKLAADLSKIRGLLNDDLYKAREVLNELTPRLSELLAEAARAARQAEHGVRELGEKAEDGNAEEQRAEVREQLAELNELEQSLEELREALSRDANEQDVLTEEGRERARDDDDALAMLEDRPDAAEEALREAVAAQEAPAQQQALAEAAREQAELAQSLEQLTEHFENLERGNANESREALREAETELGVREQLDAQFEQLEQLAELAELSPQEALARLESELSENPQMQQALEQINRETVEQAQNKLMAAADPQELERLARQEELRDELQQLARAAERLAGEQVAQAAEAMRPPTPQGEDGNPFEPPRRENEPELIDPAERALAEAQQNLEQLAAEAREPSWEDLFQLDPEEAQPLAERLRDIAEDLEQVARAEREPSWEDLFQFDPEEAEQVAQQASELAQQAAQQAQRDNQSAQQQAQAAQAAQQQNDPQMAQRSATQAANEAAQAADQAEQALNAAQLAERAAERAQSESPNSSEAMAAQASAQQAQQQAARAMAEAQQAAQAASEAAQANHVAQANQPSPQGNESSPAAQAQQMAQQAAEQAANAAREAQEAAGAARNAAQTPESENNSATQDAAQRLAQSQAAQAAESAANSQQQASAATEAAQQAASAPEGSREAARAEQMAEAAAAQAAEAAQRAAAANEQAQSAAQLASNPQAPSELAAAAARQAEQLAQRAEQLAQQLNDPSMNAPESLASAQPALAEMGQQAAEDLARAARNEGRLGNEPASESLGQIAQATQMAAEQLAGEESDSWEELFEDAAEAFTEQAQNIDELFEGGNESGMSAESGNSPPESAMAQSPSSESGQPSSESAQPAGSEPGQPSSGETAQSSASNNSSPSASESGQPGSPTPGGSMSNQSGTPLSPAAAQQLAQALDQLDQQVFGGPQQPGGQPSSSSPAPESMAMQGSPGGQPSSNSSSPSSPGQTPRVNPSGQPSPGQSPLGQPAANAAGQAAQQALASAAQAQAQSMAASRSGNSQPGSNPVGQGFAQISGGAAVHAGDIPFGELPTLEEMKKADWAKLPPKIARDLLEGSRENVSPEYRQAIEHYFRIIAERAREKRGS